MIPELYWISDRPYQIVEYLQVVWYILTEELCIRVILCCIALCFCYCPFHPYLSDVLGKKIKWVIWIQYGLMIHPQQNKAYQIRCMSQWAW